MDNKVFVSEQQEYIFYLTELDGKCRTKHLGLTEVHYYKKKLAKQWYDNIVNKLTNGDNDPTKALAELNEIYRLVVEC